jgi:hypothetical protein
MRGTDEAEHRNSSTYDPNSEICGLSKRKKRINKRTIAEMDNLWNVTPCNPADVYRRACNFLRFEQQQSDNMKKEEMCSTKHKPNSVELHCILAQIAVLIVPEEQVWPYFPPSDFKHFSGNSNAILHKFSLKHCRLSSPAPTLRSWVRIPLRHGCLCVFCVRVFSVFT